MNQRASATDILGVWATLLTRVLPDGTPDLGAIDEQVAAYKASGCDGIYCGGTASEIHCLTDSQVRGISTRFADAARRHDIAFQIGATHPLAAEELDRITFAAGLNPLAIQVILPDWTPLDPDSAIRFLKRAGEAAGGVPLVLYNPPHAKTVLTPAQLLAASRAVPALVGLKCAGGDAGWYHAMAPVLDRLSLFIPGHHHASGTRAGAHGSYSNMACLSPGAAVAWARMPDAAALDLERRIARFMQDAIAPIIARGLPGYACDKAMAAAGGWARIGPRMLWPQSGATAAEVARIAAAAHRHIPEFMRGDHVDG